MEKVEKIITFFDTSGFSATCTNWAAIDSNDNYAHKVSENILFIFVDFVDLKIFKFKSQELLGDTLYCLVLCQMRALFGRPCSTVIMILHSVL